MTDTAVAVPERKLTLAEITDQLAACRDTLEGLDGDDGPDAALIRAKLEQLESLHTNKVDRVCAFLKWLDAEQNGLKADKQRFERRQRQYADLENRRRESVRDLMRENEITQMKGRAFTLSLCPGKQRLEITDESLIPIDYMVFVPARTIPETCAPDADAIEAALKRGEDVPGARLVEGEPYIRVT